MQPDRRRDAGEGPSPRQLPEGARIAQMPPTALPESEVPELTEAEVLRAREEARHARAEAERAAKRRLREAEAGLRRARRTEERADRRAARRARAVDRRIRRVEEAARQPVWPMVTLVLVLDALASALLVGRLLWPGSIPELGLVAPWAGEWEFAGYLFIGVCLGAGAMLTLTPTVDFQRRARSAMAFYMATAMVVALLGLLMAVALRPMDGVPAATLTPVATWLAIAAAGAGLPAAAIWLLAGLRGSRLPYNAAYNWSLGVLLAVAACALVVLPLVLLAIQGWVARAGWALALAGAVGVLFPLPVVLGSFVAEYRLGRTQARPL